MWDMARATMRLSAFGLNRPPHMPDARLLPSIYCGRQRRGRQGRLPDAARDRHQGQYAIPIQADDIAAILLDWIGKRVIAAS
jgi:hypothetical protein